jgi:hypothetical protein
MATKKKSINTLDKKKKPSVVPPDQQKTTAQSAQSATSQNGDAFVIEKSGLNVVASGKYSFSFSYLYSDPDNPSAEIIGPRSANFSFSLSAPDYTKPVTNLVVTPGLLLYGVRWDAIDKSVEANKWFIDAQIYESLTGTFTGEEYLVWNGTGSSATILVSNTNNRWIRVDTRDQDYHKKSVTYGPFKATDPITVDTVGPSNVESVTITSGIDTSGYLGFNAYANISWPAVTGGGIRGYRIRFSNDNNATYSYVDSPGTGTTYKLAGLAIGSTYKIAVATYDEYNNTSSSYVSGTDVTVTGTPSVSNYISGGPFQFGVGVGSVSTNKGIYFDASNYWYVNATNSARLKVGGDTSNYLLWDGSTFAIDGNITARSGTFSGNIFMSTSGASIYNGTIDAATGNLTGNGFALNSTGLKVANGTNSVTIAAATGTITANAGSIGGWNLSGTTLSKNNVILDSSGQIQVGATAAQSVYIKSSGDYVVWAGNNTPDSNAKFRVHKDGTLYATGAVFGSGTSISGYATSSELSSVSSTASTALNTANSASTTAVNAANAVALKLSASDINSVLDSNTTVINGSRVTTGTIDVARLNIAGGSAANNGFVVDGNGIRGYSSGLLTVNIGTLGSSEIGGFLLGNADLTASTSKLPRIIFGNKVLIGYDNNNGAYTLNAGNPRGDSGSSFYVNTDTNVFRFAADSASRSYAAEIRNDVRARDFRYIRSLVNDSSSRRFKENITYVPKSYYDKILNLTPAFYTYIENHPETDSALWGTHSFGPIAEDLEDAGLGLFVQRNLSGQPTALQNEHKLAFLLIPIIRELKEKIQVMDQKILDLESKSV